MPLLSFKKALSSQILVFLLPLFLNSAEYYSLDDKNHPPGFFTAFLLLPSIFRRTLMWGCVLTATIGCLFARNRRNSNAMLEFSLHFGLFVALAMALDSLAPGIPWISKI